MKESSSTNKNEKTDENYLVGLEAKKDENLIKTADQESNDTKNTNNKGLFDDNTKSLFRNEKSLFNNNESLFQNSSSLFGENKKSLFDNDTNPPRENNKTLFGNEKCLFSNNEPLFQGCDSLFGEKNKALFENNNSLFSDNKKTLLDKNQRLFSDNETFLSNSTSLFGDNNKTLFDNDKSLFRDNKKTLLEKDKRLFSDNEQFLPNSTNLFGDKYTTLFGNNKNLFGEKNITLFGYNEKNDEKDSSSDDKNDNDNNDNNSDSKKEEKILDEIEDNEEEDDGDDNNDEDNEKIEKIKTRYFKGRLKWYSKKKNVPKPFNILPDNKYLKKNLVKYNTEIVSFLHLREEFENYVDIKELKNGNIILLFNDKIIYFNPKTFQLLKIANSIKKYLKKHKILDIEEINKDLIGIICKKITLIIEVNNKELQLFQKIEIKANILKSFEEGKILIINEYIYFEDNEEDGEDDVDVDDDDEDNYINRLNYFIYDKELKYKLKSSETINFKPFTKIKIKEYDLFNKITNIKEYKNNYLILFTLSTIPEAEKKGFDSDYRSFYERDCSIYLNIYLYEKNSKEIAKIYKKSFKDHFKYGFSIFETEYADVLKIWRDDNINYLSENEILFLIPNKSYYVKFNLESKSNEIISSIMKNHKCYFYNNKNNSYYCLEENSSEEEQIIQVFILVNNEFKEVNKIYLPYYYSDIFLNKKGNLIGVVKNTRIVYSYYTHWGKYAPAVRTYTSISLININKK